MQPIAPNIELSMQATKIEKQQNFPQITILTINFESEKCWDNVLSGMEG